MAEAKSSSSETNLRSRVNGNLKQPQQKGGAYTSKPPADKKISGPNSNRATTRLTNLSLKSFSRVITLGSSDLNDESSRWWFTFGLITIVAFATRLFKIHLPNHVWCVLAHF